METSSSNQNEVQTKKCPFCAEEILSDATDCSFCGKDLTSRSKKPKKQMSHFLPWIFGLFLIIAILWLYVEVGRIKGIEAYLNTPTINTRVIETTLDIQSIASDLIYVRALAENADSYAHTHYSDAQLKENVSPIEDALVKLMKVHGVNFTWRPDLFLEFPDSNQVGVIAQEVEAVFPELITHDTNGYKMVDYSKLTPILIEAMREQQDQISELKKQIDYLESQIKNLSIKQ